MPVLPARKIMMILFRHFTVLDSQGMKGFSERLRLRLGWLREHREVVALILIPLVMLTVNSEWLFTQIGWIDPWYNVGYFLNYDTPKYLDWSYKSGRLPWIIPGYLVYSTFTPLVANYLLHLLPLIGGGLLLFYSILPILNRNIAFISSIFLICYIHFHGSGGWDYQTTPGGFYYLLAFYLAVQAGLRERQEKLLLLGCGLAFGATIHANVVLINLAPLIAFQFVAALHVRGVRAFQIKKIVLDCVLIAVGGLAITILLGVMNAIAGRDFFFFKKLLSLVFTFVSDPVEHQTQWWLPWSDLWFLKHWAVNYLMVPFGVFVVSSVSLVRGLILLRRSPAICSEELQSLVLITQYLFVVLLWILWQSNGQTALQPSYYTHPMIVPMVLALAGSIRLWSGEGGLGNRYTPRTVTVMSVIAIAPLSLGVLRLVEPIVLSPGFWLALFVVVVAVFVVVAGREKSAVGAALVFGLLNATVASHSRGTPNYAVFGECPSHKSSFLGLVEGNRLMAKHNPDMREMYVWWDDDEVLKSGGCELSISKFSHSLRALGSRYLTPPWDGMPSAENIPAESFSNLRPDPYIAVVTANLETLDRLSDRLVQEGRTFDKVGMIQLGEHPEPFYLHILAQRAATAETTSR